MRTNGFIRQTTGVNISVEMESNEIMNKSRSCWSSRHRLCPLNAAYTASGETKRLDQRWLKSHTLTHTRGCESERKARAESEELIEVVCFTAGSLLNAMSPLGHGE